MFSERLENDTWILLSNLCLRSLCLRDHLSVVLKRSRYIWRLLTNPDNWITYAIKSVSLKTLVRVAVNHWKDSYGGILTLFNLYKSPIHTLRPIQLRSRPPWCYLKLYMHFVEVDNTEHASSKITHYLTIAVLRLTITGDDDHPCHGPHGIIIGIAFLRVFIRFRNAHYRRVSLTLLSHGMKTPNLWVLVHNGLYFNCETDRSVQPKVALE